MVMMIPVLLQGCWEAPNPLKAANVEFICFPKRKKPTLKWQAGRSRLRQFRSARCGVLSPLLGSLNYLDNEKPRKKQRSTLQKQQNQNFQL